MGYGKKLLKKIIAYNNHKWSALNLKTDSYYQLPVRLKGAAIFWQHYNYYLLFKLRNKNAAVKRCFKN